MRDKVTNRKREKEGKEQSRGPVALRGLYLDICTGVPRVPSFAISAYLSRRMLDVATWSPVSAIVHQCHSCFSFYCGKLVKACISVTYLLHSLAAWHLPGGPVGPASRWAATSDVEVGQTTYPVM